MDTVDSHQVNQGKLKDIKDKLDENNLVELQDGFEDSFSNAILMKAISKLYSSHGLIINDGENLNRILASRESSTSILGR